VLLYKAASTGTAHNSNAANTDSTGIMNLYIRFFIKHHVGDNKQSCRSYYRSPDRYDSPYTGKEYHQRPIN
jgi:hypothetical protein